MKRSADVSTPCLSEIIRWDTTHLEAAAQDWNTTAQQWQDRFTGVQRATLAPGGTAWDGDAAEAVQERAFADLVRVRDAAGSLQAAATVAYRGADQLNCAKRMVLEAVNDAEELGFIVGEDLSVSSQHHGVDWISQVQVLTAAKRHAATITVRAAELRALDEEVAAKIAASSAPLSELTFAETSTTSAAEAEDLAAVEFLSEDRKPTGVVILCEPGPRGGPWEFDCHVIYPGGGADLYPSDIDDSGGYP